MRPRDWFLVAVRVYGVYVFCTGLYSLAILIPAAFTDQPARNGFEEGLYYFWLAFVNLGIGAYLLLGTERLTRWVFKEIKADDSADEAADEMPEHPVHYPL